ncbi:MAG: hypothetical protein ACFCVB_05545 [Nodosilinea sp.]
MANVLIPKVTEDVLQHLANLAQAHGHSLEEEARRLLEQAVVAATPSRANDISSQKVALMQQQIEDHAREMGQPVESSDVRSTMEQQDLEQAFACLKQLKQRLTLGRPLQAAREEGRRF